MDGRLWEGTDVVRCFTDLSMDMGLGGEEISLYTIK